jgi:hypothetical protein
MSLTAALWGVAALLCIALLAVPVDRSRAAGPSIYAACLIVSLVIAGAGVVQMTAGSFAQPIRRVVGDVAFRVRDHVDMAAPVGQAVRLAAEKLDRLQFLTIRKCLSLAFVALTALLLSPSV